MINFIIVIVVGLYLLFGLILTWRGLKTEEFAVSTNDLGFLSLTYLILLFVLTTPIFFIRLAYKHLKMGGETNVKKSRDEEK